MSLEFLSLPQNQEIIQSLISGHYTTRDKENDNTFNVWYMITGRLTDEMKENNGYGH